MNRCENTTPIPFLEVDIINIRNTINKQLILISLILILAFTTLSNNTTIAPFFLFVGIIIGICENNDKTRILVNTIISTIVGSVISFILSLIVVYYTESPLYAIITLQSLPVYLVLYVLYIVLALCGGLIGYYVVEEIRENKEV